MLERMSLDVKTRELIEYLEQKIIDGDARDDEYGLYIEYKKYGYEALKWRGYLCKRLKDEYIDIYEEV